MQFVLTTYADELPKTTFVNLSISTGNSINKDVTHRILHLREIQMKKKIWMNWKK